MQNGREEQIRNRAYELWEQEGHKEGQPEDYWYRAEQELNGAEGGAEASGNSENGNAGGTDAAEDSSKRAPEPARRSARR